MFVSWLCLRWQWRTSCVFWRGGCHPARPAPNAFSLTTAATSSFTWQVVKGQTHLYSLCDALCCKTFMIDALLSYIFLVYRLFLPFNSCIFSVVYILEYNKITARFPTGTYLGWRVIQLKLMNFSDYCWGVFFVSLDVMSPLLNTAGKGT